MGREQGEIFATLYFDGEAMLGSLYFIRVVLEERYEYIYARAIRGYTLKNL